MPFIHVNTSAQPVAPGKFEPTWESLKRYQTPEWFRDAKFGIWAHWGPQCQPERGDWYARNMYLVNSAQNKFHAEHYGDPAAFGFKEVINEWKAERWDPERLVALYKRAGAQYFFAMANHHDNLDLWDSKYQPWNSTRVGPKKDVVAGWAKAARANGLPFGISVHASHAWTWYEPSQQFDGNLTLADGKGKWWDGLDPQELYAQRHAPSTDYLEPKSMHVHWDWQHGASTPSQAYVDKFYNRTIDLIDTFHPDLVYFDDTALPFWPISDAGLAIAAHLYNSNMAANGGDLRAVIFGKVLDDEQRKAIVWDIERGVPATMLPFAWQTDTCIGDWHYDRPRYDKGQYKSAATVIHMLADIVSKNGNLLLNIPVRGDGTIDEKEEMIVNDIAAWMDVNRECIFGTRPWKVFGEGPASDGAPISAQGFNEGKGKPFTAEDVRFTTKGDAIYAIVLGRASAPAKMKSLGKTANLLGGEIERVEQLSAGEVKWERNAEALEITPATANDSRVDHTIVFKIHTRGR